MKFFASELKSILDPKEKRLKKFKIHSVLFGVEANATLDAPQVTNSWLYHPHIQYQAPGNSMQYGYGPPPHSPTYSAQSSVLSFDSSSNNEAQ